MLEAIRQISIPNRKGQVKASLFDRKTIDRCPWPYTQEGEYVRAFLSPLIRENIASYVDNVCAELKVLVVDQTALPITINEAEYENAHVCSPFSFYISCALQSLDAVKQKWLRTLFKPLLRGLGWLFQKCDLNRVVIVNNWLFSTNLYPSLQQEHLETITQTLLSCYPNHAIVFRCVDPVTNPTCHQSLADLGFDYIATRQIYFIEPHKTALKESRLFKSDVKLLKNSGYEVIDETAIQDEDIPRLIALYRNVYIDKYSSLNPSFNENYLKLVLREKLMHFKALRKEGRIDGIAGFVVREGKMYCPFFGYDVHLPKESALYRLTSTLLMLEACEKELFFHQSAGASSFKKMRKASDEIEYTAVYHKHLSLRRKLPWIILRAFYNTVGLFYMRRY